MLQFDYLGREGRWDDILRLARQRKANSIFNTIVITYHVDQALFQKGRLLEDLFDYPQEWGVRGLIMPEQVTLTVQWQKCDYYFKLGLINQAQVWAHECETMCGETPWVLKRLAQIYILNRQPAAAQTIRIAVPL